MSATTCFLTPVRVLVTLRKQRVEKFMTLEVSCPPSKTATLLSSSPPSAAAAALLSLSLSALPSTPNLSLDSSDTSHFDESVQNDITRVSAGPGWRSTTTAARTDSK